MKVTGNMYLSRMSRLCMFTLAMIIRLIVRTDRKQLFFWSYSFEKYACSPKAFTEYVLNNTDGTYKIVWAFTPEFNTSNIDSRIKVVRTNTIQYLIELYRSGFVMNNMRNDLFATYFLKKKTQKYIMMWHGPFALKRIEKDAEKQLSKEYVRNAKLDSRMCDLMLSNSKMFTRLIRSSFWYTGEILEKGIPRNDVFYDKALLDRVYKEFRSKYGIPNCTKVVLYAPTFRKNKENLSYYKIDWSKIIPAFEKMLGGNVEVFIKLHPNMTNVRNIDSLSNYNHVHDVTCIPDITELLFSSDVLISDYSSTMFDFAMMYKPVFIYAIDKNTYDRGFYHELKTLPFSLSEDEDGLIAAIKNFNKNSYESKLRNFFNRNWGVKENGNASEALFEWMKRYE